MVIDQKIGVLVVLLELDVSVEVLAKRDHFLDTLSVGVLFGTLLAEIAIGADVLYGTLREAVVSSGMLNTKVESKLTIGLVVSVDVPV